MSNQTKSEKQVIDAKIAKVREVVHNVSKNDIILALHNHDMDVSKTINAFTAGNMEAALGEWTQKGVAGKKNKQKKKNKAANADSSSSTTTETPKLSTVSAPRTQVTTNPAPVQRPTQPIKHAVDTKPLSTSDLDSLLHSLDIKTAHINKNLDNVYAEQSHVISTIQAALHARERQLLNYLDQVRKQVDAKVHQQRTNIQKFKQNKPSGEELARLKAEHDSLDSYLETNFQIHGDKALKAIEKLGSSFLAPSAEPVHYAPPPVVHHQVNGTTQQEKPTKNGQPAQQQAPAPPKPQQNGKPVNKHVNGTDIKHSVSHSSLVSEENDSGYGQHSPVHPEKNVAQVSDGGFLFTSDGLDADQLAKLQAQVAENLKAQGIDPTILASLASSDSSAPRRRQNQPSRAKENGKPAHKENKKPTGGKAVKS